MQTMNKEIQAAMTPQDALAQLREGNQRFVNHAMLERNLLHQVEETKTGQAPFAAVLGCIDSRVSPEIIFDQGVGDIFGCRVAGNIVNEDILGSIEFVLELLKQAEENVKYQLSSKDLKKCIKEENQKLCRKENIDISLLRSKKGTQPFF